VLPVCLYCLAESRKEEMAHRNPPPPTGESQHIVTALRWFLVIAVIVTVGVMGYRIVEGWSWLESIYMVAITMSTVGFGEVRPMSPGGVVFTVFFVMVSVGTIGFALARLMNVVLEGHISGFRRERRMQKLIDKLEDHVIVCGYGRVGQEVVSELVQRGGTALVVDLDPPIEELDHEKLCYLKGNASNEEVLLQAGIKRARCLIAAMDSDTENVFTVLTARTLNPQLQLIARASEPGTTRKLKMVGADRVISPYVTSGRRMAAMAMQPEVVDFLEHFNQPLDEIGLELGKVEIIEGSLLDNNTLARAEIRRRSGAMVLAVYTAAGVVFNPDAEMELKAGQRLMVLGSQQQLLRLKEMAAAAS